MPCQHCKDAPCIKEHPDCIYRRDDGIVLIDPIKSKGKKTVVDSCPYGAIYWNEAEDIPQKCTMCAHLVDNGWEMPRCAHSCPTGAMGFHNVDETEMEKIIATEGLETYCPEHNTKPNVYYKNLHKFTKCFITGGILKDGDCAESINVSLTGNLKAEQVTNYFGEFKFDGLLPGTYTLAIDGKEIRTVTIEESLNVGNITI